MDFLTIVGYIFAALAIALGLYLMLRKNATSENTTTATEQAMPDDNHSNDANNHNSGRIPVVPRHKREQLSQPDQAAAPHSAQPGINQPAVTTSRHADKANQSGFADPGGFIATSSFDADNDLLAEVPDIKAERTALEQAVTDDRADQYRNSAAASSPMMAQQAQIQALAESSKPDQDPVEDTFDQVLAQLEAATSADSVDDSGNDSSVNDSSVDDSIQGGSIQAGSSHEHDLAQASTSSRPAGTAGHAGKDLLATADVEEWQGESALLDAHLQDQERRDDESALAQAEHIVALYVMPNAGRTLSGERTIQLLRQFGLRYGEMSLFHRFADADGTGPLMFSVLRYASTGPSGFDLETLPAEQVEGLAFFLALPSKHAVAGYDTMVSISTLLAREIHGQVYDEHMNQLSPQLREHYRHFVLEYRQPA